MSPPLITYVAPTAGFAIATALALGLRAALKGSVVASSDRAAYLRNGVAILFGWWFIALALSWFEFFRGTPQRFPTIWIGVFTPIVIGLWMLWRVRSLDRLISAVPQPWLIGVQVYRALGVIFLLLLARGDLPGQFAWPAGVGDLIVGMTAPLVATTVARARPYSAALVLAWNIFGLADLVVAVSMGFLTSPSPFQVFSLMAPNELISAFPLVMVPAFAVPVSVLLHVVSLMKLGQESHAAIAHA